MSATATLTAADYEVVIGLEVHVQLKTNTKMFCGCKNEFGGATTLTYCPVPRDAGRFAGAERGGDREDAADGRDAGLPDRDALQVRPEELFLSGHAEELSDLAVRRAALRGRRGDLDLLAAKDAQKDPETIADKQIRLVRAYTSRRTWRNRSLRRRHERHRLQSREDAR